MLHVAKNGPDRLDLELSGKLDRKAMAAGIDELVAQSANVHNGSMLYRIENFAMPSMRAIAVEIKRLPEMLALARRFKRAAVLSDKRWIRRVSQWKGALFPALEIRAFKPDEEDMAEAWLAS